MFKKNQTNQFITIFIVTTHFKHFHFFMLHAEFLKTVSEQTALYNTCDFICILIIEQAHAISFTIA